MITCNNVGDKTIKEEKEKKNKNEEIRKEGWEETQEKRKRHQRFQIFGRNEPLPEYGKNPPLNPNTETWNGQGAGEDWSW